MYKIKHSTVKIKTREYIDQYYNNEKFIFFCKECSKYNNFWMCPPFNFSPINIISQYANLNIIGTQIFINNEIQNNHYNKKQMEEITHLIFSSVRKHIDKYLLNIENKYNDSMVFFAGSCYNCYNEKCTRPQGIPCRHPDKSRYSLESFGFDLEKTSLELLNIELKWGKSDLLPEYFTLISGLASNNENMLLKLNSRDIKNYIE